MNTKTTVYVCHWHGRYRKFLRSIFSDFNETIVQLGECGEHQQLAKWLQQKPTVDFVLIGFPRSVTNEANIIRELSHFYPQVKFVIMSPFKVDNLYEFYSKAGAYDHYATNQDPEELLKIFLD